MGIKEIKPCPFCGGKASYKDVGHLFSKEHVYVVNCSVCECTTPIYEDLIEAIKCWNKRVNVAKVKNDHFAHVGKKDTMSLTLALIILDRLNTTERIDVARDNLAEAVRVVSAAAKKQVPQKPKPDLSYYSYGECPTCGAVFQDKPTNYCNTTTGIIRIAKRFVKQCPLSTKFRLNYKKEREKDE